MTKKLEDLFDLKEIDTDDLEIVEDQPTLAQTQAPTENTQQLLELNDQIDKIDAALPSIKDITSSDEEMDELAKMAMEEFRNLMRLGMNCDPRFGAEIFNTASSMLGHAINAKSAKVNNKLRVVQLQIAKRRVDIQQARLETGQAPEVGEATELTKSSRNAILAEILAYSDAKKDK